MASRSLAKERQAYVLEQMTRHGFVTEQQAREAYAQPLQLTQRQVDLKAPHWVMFIRDLVEQKYGDQARCTRRGLRIYTTLDLGLQRADAAGAAATRKVDHRHAGGNQRRARSPVDPKTGEILGFNGSLDYDDESKSTVRSTC